MDRLGEAGATDEEDSLEEPDEQLQAILRRTYAGDTLDEKWSVHPAVQDLAEFASLWFAALDQQASPDDGAGSLSPDELVYLWKWSRRILSQRGAKHTGTGKWAFQDAVRKADPVSSDAFLGLLDSLEQWSRANPRLTSFYARSGLAVKLEGASGRSQNFVVAEQDGKKLLLKVKATAGSDTLWGLQGVEALGAQLQAELAPLGFATSARNRFLRLVFNGPGGTDHRPTGSRWAGSCRCSRPCWTARPLFRSWGSLRRRPSRSRPKDERCGGGACPLDPSPQGRSSRRISGDRARSRCCSRCIARRSSCSSRQEACEGRSGQARVRPKGPSRAATTPGASKSPCR